jgi:hypothetical protein
LDYAAYVEAFNSGADRGELVRRFCTDDVIFEAGARKELYRGRDEVTRFLSGLQDSFREALRPQVVVQNKDYIAVEADVDLYAQRDLTDDPALGALKKGERFTMKAFAIYYLRNGKICRFKTALWPPNFGVTNPPTA